MIYVRYTCSYILVPLLMLLDGVTSCRKEVAGPEEKHSLANNGPHLVRDNVAESLFFCLQELLKRCHQSCVDQVKYIQEMNYIRR